MCMRYIIRISHRESASGGSEGKKKKEKKWLRIVCFLLNFMFDSNSSRAFALSHDYEGLIIIIIIP